MSISTQSTDGCYPAAGCLSLQLLARQWPGQYLEIPYIAGENGGAFVLIYLVCVAFVGAPIMISEVMLGRKGRQPDKYHA